MRSKLISEAHRASAKATAYCAAVFSGTGSCSGFNRIASMLGNSRNLRKKADPAPSLDPQPNRIAALLLPCTRVTQRAVLQIFECFPKTWELKCEPRFN
jgi:hypothetical protein